MNKKYDTSLFATNAKLKGKDLRNVEFKRNNDEYEDCTSVVNKSSGQIIYGVGADIDGNKYYTPPELSNMSHFEAKVRLLNNDIDNYGAAKNAKLTNRDSYFTSDNNHTTTGMIYEDKKIGAAKRQETINDMAVKPEDYVFVSKVSSGTNNTGFLGNNGEFIENWGAPVDTSVVKYYTDLEECVCDSVLFNYKNSINHWNISGEPFVAIEKSSLK